MATRKSPRNNKRRKGFRAVALPWLRRFGVVLACATLIVWLGAWFFLSDADTRTAQWAKQRGIEKTAALGFTVEDVLVEGRVHSDPAIIKALINVQPGDPFFAFDPKEARALLEDIAWVDRAHVERRWPDTIYIRLEERVPLALWQQDKKLRLLDTKGTVISGANLRPFKDLMIVIGPEAPEHAPELIAYLLAEPVIAERVEAATRIDGRRWDLTLKNGLKIKMPQEDFGLALRSLAKEHEDNIILDRDIVAVDMRKTGRIIVRTRPGAVREYKAGFSSRDDQSGNSI